MKISTTKIGFFSKADLPRMTNFAGMVQHLLTGENGMVVWSQIKAGTFTALHSHPNEQITWVLNGKLEFQLGEQKQTCGPGDLVLVPGDVPHEVLYVTDCDIIEFFTPPRLDLFPQAATSPTGA